MEHARELRVQRLLRMRQPRQQQQQQQPRRQQQQPRLDVAEAESEGTSSESSDSSTSTSTAPASAMRCVSCQECYAKRRAGTCKDCYDEANDTEDDLKRQIEDLNSKLSFLRSWAPPPLQSDPASSTFQPPPFSDVVLVASLGPTSPIPAHKAVLVSRSPVFKAMLENEMEESRSGAVKICDVSHEALRVFVGYLYNAEAALDENMACELLVLAEKYEVQHLKAYCEAFLISKLTCDNSVASFAFAHQHRAEQLVDAALSLITDNMDKLAKREEYLELKARDPRLVVDIYEAYLAKQVNTG